MNLFDSHAHFDHFATAEERAAACDRAAAAGVSRILAIGGSAAGNAAALETAGLRPAQVRACVGWDRGEASRAPDPEAVRAMLGDARVAAVGETGLDYHYDRDTAPAQRALFDAMLGLAGGAGLPVVVHTREADDDTVAALAAHADAWRGGAGRIGVIHCFTGSWPFARRLLDLGFHISFSGIVTFARAADLRDAASRVPADRLLVETDSPYLAPVPHRGRPNEPALLPFVAAAVAAARGVAPEDLAETARRNAETLFGVWSAGDASRAAR
ncbi:MAG: TatD family deoxyribonuclease [Lentisphaerae bacterium]|nr:TatD family deoxyribonuclease [Lentisphaerota bacterium]